jgi:hypothetical protein
MANPKQELLKAKRKEILALAEAHGAANIRLFGSIVRGENTELSDVDFLVQMNEGRNLWDLIGLTQNLEELLHCKVDVVTEGDLSPYLRERILASAAPL